MVQQAGELGLPSVALVDANGVYGAPRFYKAAKEAGVRALVGAEIMLDRPRPAAKPDPKKKKESAPGAGAPGTRRRAAHPARREPHRLPEPLPPAHRRRAREAEGRGVVTPGSIWPSTPRGCTVPTGGDEGPVARGARRRRASDAARGAPGTPRALFSAGGLHVELQRHRLRDEEHRNRALIDLARRLRLPLVATNGVRYARERGQGAPRRPHLHPQSHHARRRGPPPRRASRAALQERRRDGGALSRTCPRRSTAHASSPNARLHARRPRLPVPRLPAAAGRDARLRTCARSPGTAPRRASGRSRPRPRRRSRRSWTMIEKLDLAGYFLIVWDIVQLLPARERSSCRAAARRPTARSATRSASPPSTR